MIKLDICESKSIKKAFYNLVTKVLVVEFHSVKEILYVYENVPDVIAVQFEATESAGKYFLNNIKNKFEFKKLDNKINNLE